MKRLTCEMCGSTNLIKKEGLFECQDCGTKYSVEDAKKMMVEVDGTVEVTGTVQVDNSNQLDNLLKNIETLYTDGKYDEVYKKCDAILIIDPDNPKAMLYRGFADAWNNTNGKNNNIYAAITGFERAVSSAKKRGEKESIGGFIGFSSLSMPFLVIAIKQLYSKLCTSEVESQGRLAQMEARFIGTSYSRSDANEHKRKSEEYMNKAKQAINTLEKRLNDLFSTSNDLAEAMINAIDDPADFAKTVFEAIKTYINTYKDAKDLTNYSVKTRCTQLFDKVTALQEKGGKVRVERYWEANKDEKEELIKKLAEMDEIIDKANKNKSAFQPKIDEIEAKRNEYLGLEKEINKKKGNLRELKFEKGQLGMFQGKRKKELTQTIDALEKEIEENEKEYSKKKSEMEPVLDKEMEAIKEQCKPFEHKIIAAERTKKRVQEQLDDPYSNSYKLDK